MSLSEAIRRALTGLSVPQEYCVVDKHNLSGQLQLLLTDTNDVFAANVSGQLLFLGYKPLIMAIALPDASVACQKIKDWPSIKLYFLTDAQTSVAVEQKGFSDFTALLVLTKLTEVTLDTNRVLIYEGKAGTHYFINPLHQWINRIKGKLKRRNAGNVSLPGNLNDQVRIAYSIPTVISIITTCDQHKMNLFPTDLHGTIGDEWYVGSLRTGGMANAQVTSLKRIVISEMPVSYYRQTYGLGRNHMQELKAEAEFKLHLRRSQSFDFPLPEGAVSYREMELVKTIRHGIHQIHFYRVVAKEVIGGDSSLLSHIHQYYVQWRTDNGIPTNWFKR